MRALRSAGREAVLAVLVALVLVSWSGTRVRAGDAAGGGVIVALADGATPADVANTLAAHGAHLTGRIEQLNLVTAEAAPGTAGALLAGLRRHRAVRYAEPDRVVAAPAAAPNDPLYGGAGQWNIDRVKAPDAWDLLPPGGNTIVAVLDTGIDYDHPDLAGRISPAACDAFHHTCGTGQSRRQPDAFGHGTHVAGIIGAATNNGVGVASVSGGRVTLLPIQVLSPGGENVEESIIVSAIVYAVDQGAKVINMSFGGPCGSEVEQATRDAITYAEAHDVLLVFAAGNDGGCREGRFPQNDPRVLSVAATDISDNSAPFTDRGLTVAVAAPGVRILSTVPRSCNTGICDASGYRAISGTSMAAPHVAAQAALLFQAPGATKAKVVQWITSTCDPAGVSTQCGGRINVYRSVYLAMKGYDPLAGPPAPPAADQVSPPDQPVGQPEQDAAFSAAR